MAMPSNQRLIIIAKTVPTVGHNRVKPSVYFNPTAQPTSSSPAITRMTQAMYFLSQMPGSSPMYVGARRSHALSEIRQQQADPNESDRNGDQPENTKHGHACAGGRNF